jgi:hypothetical protein
MSNANCCARLDTVPQTQTREVLYHRSGVKIMSFRNGDKSREHRLRKAKEKKREKVRKLVIKSDAKKPSTVSSAKK